MMSFEEFFIYVSDEQTFIAVLNEAERRGYNRDIIATRRDSHTWKWYVNHERNCGNGIALVFTEEGKVGWDFAYYLNSLRKDFPEKQVKDFVRKQPLGILFEK